MQYFIIPVLHYFTVSTVLCTVLYVSSTVVQYSSAPLQQGADTSTRTYSRNSAGQVALLF
jgi:hypothetical protein